jgi:hypothetical protein
MCACGQGSEECVNLLLERGADTTLVDTGDDDRVTAMDIARNRKRNNIVKILEFAEMDDIKEPAQ